MLRRPRTWAKEPLSSTGPTLDEARSAGTGLPIKRRKDSTYNLPVVFSGRLSGGAYGGMQPDAPIIGISREETAAPQGRGLMAPGLVPGKAERSGGLRKAECLDSGRPAKTEAS